MGENDTTNGFTFKQAHLLYTYAVRYAKHEHARIQKQSCNHASKPKAMKAGRAHEQGQRVTTVYYYLHT